MDNLHFAYALDCGTFDAHGTPIRIFGHSSLEKFGGRWTAYQKASLIPPILCGVIIAEDKSHAGGIVKSILNRFSGCIPTTRDKTEILLGYEEVLEFIENEMEDGEAFLGMPAHEFALDKTRKYQKDYAQRTGKSDKQRERYHTDPEYRERHLEYGREKTRRKREARLAYEQTDEYKEEQRKKRELELKRARERQRERYRTDPVYRERQNNYWRNQKKHEINPDQTKLFEK